MVDSTAIKITRQRSLKFSRPDILVMYENPQRFKNQLNSTARLNNKEEIDLYQLKANISTDHIIRVSDILTSDINVLGQKVFGGLGQEYGITPGSIQKAKYKVVVAGPLFGCGSSREQAVWALLGAGVKIVIAPSFGPIFEENAAYVGLLTTTDLKLVEEILQGRPLNFTDFLQGRSTMQKAVIGAGGLFNYLKKADKVKLRNTAVETGTKPQTIFEKRLIRTLNNRGIKITNLKEGSEMLMPVDMAYSYVGLSNLAIHALKNHKIKLPREKIFLFEDHFPQSLRKEIPFLTKQQRSFAKNLQLSKDNYFYGKVSEGGGLGICHRVMLNNIDPRESVIVIATDSHTPTIGALPILGIPVGSTLFAAALAEGMLPISLPLSTRVELKGKLPPGLTIRDAQLEIAARDSQSSQVIEYGGDGLDHLSFSDVAALCNMVPEVFANGKIAVCQSYRSGRDFLKKRYEISEEEASLLYGYPDNGVEYYKITKFDLGKTSPWLAMPGSPHSGVSLRELNEFPKIQKAYLVSCTLGKEELRQGAAVLKDQKIKKGVKLIVVPSLLTYQRDADMRGVWQIFRKAGAVIGKGSACSSCIGEGPGVIGEGEFGITASNRNYPGRMGSNSGKVYLGGPVLTALAALLGRIPSITDFQMHLPRIIKNINDE